MWIVKENLNEFRNQREHDAWMDQHCLDKRRLEEVNIKFLI